MASPAFATRTHRPAPAAHFSSTHSGSAHSRSSHRAAPRSHKLHGQTAIEPARVTEIQQALIREHYLSTEANGQWDAATEAAMQKYQADQGWQTRLMPDSRALKKLGLGPDYSGAINAKNSSFVDPPPVSTIPNEQASGFAQAAGINR
ncbi:MAG TPA: peptidoglycan-binding domain-containing protein [Terracidiphilus sp.]|nr:peptidoglycan-binding domain-containing protein [Terracidiphilus sp.]